MKLRMEGLRLVKGRPIGERVLHVCYFLARVVCLVGLNYFSGPKVDALEDHQRRGSSSEPVKITIGQRKVQPKKTVVHEINSRRYQELKLGFSGGRKRKAGRSKGERQLHRDRTESGEFGQGEGGSG